MHLTDYGQQVAQAITNGDYRGIAGADEGYRHFNPWAEEFADRTARILEVDPASVGGIIAGLSSAGFLVAGDASDPDSDVRLTEAGRDYCATLAAD